MKHIILLSLIIALISCGTSKTPSQTTAEVTAETAADCWSNPPDSCNVKDSTDWENVIVCLMEKKSEPNWFDVQGENMLELSSSITKIADIPTGTIEAMQTIAASYGGCILFVDLLDYWGSKMFPMRKSGQVYFYWSVPK